jgi:hypothetical protein
MLWFQVQVLVGPPTFSVQSMKVRMPHSAERQALSTNFMPSSRLRRPRIGVLLKPLMAGASRFLRHLF